MSLVINGRGGTKSTYSLIFRNGRFVMSTHFDLKAMTACPELC